MRVVLSCKLLIIRIRVYILYVYVNAGVSHILSKFYNDGKEEEMLRKMFSSELYEDSMAA